MRKFSATTIIALLANATLGNSAFCAPPPWQYGWWDKGAHDQWEWRGGWGPGAHWKPPWPSLGLPLAGAWQPVKTVTGNYDGPVPDRGTSRPPGRRT